MNQYTVKDFGKIIKKNAQSQRHELLPNGTDVFRIYDRNQEDFPITVDVYANYARVQVYSDSELDPETVEIITDQINRMGYFDRDKIIFSYRAKRDKGQQHEKTDNEAVLVSVKENNLSFKTDLTTYTDTGLFLDHINTRAMIKELAPGKNVLNLFSYTGSFSVYAASGLASKVTSVDMSATYTRWAEENLRLNGFEGDNYPCVCCDATKFVQDALKQGTKYDIIIFDPPAFSNSHKMEEDFDVQRDFYEWIRNLRALLTKSGVIMFSTNLGNFKIDKRRVKGFNVKETTSQLWADGFVKGRKGTTRSWLMAMDENSLTLDWSEDKSERKGEKKEYKPRRENRGERHSERSGERRSRSYGDRRDSRDHRDYGERRDRRERSDRPERSERREFRGDRERRDYGDRREHREYGERRERRDFGERREHRDYGERRERRDYDRPRFEHRDHSDYESKHRFSERRDDRRDERPRFDRPRSERSDRFRSDRPRREDSREKKDKKPYGYDSFKPARSRDDSADFFWNED